MEILDQRKESIINTNFVQEIYASYEGKVNARIDDCLNVIMIGEYSSKEEAQKIVNQIFRSMTNYLRTYEMPKKGE